MAQGERVAVVTGGASGIGLGIVRHLLGEGLAVVAADRDERACAAARDDLAPFGARARVIAADIGTPEGAERAIAEAVSAFGRLDLLCNNAAVHPLERIADHDIDSWRETFRVNVDGTMLCSKYALAAMGAGGAIVNIGSISGVAPYAEGGAYGASKAAVAMLTRVLALEAGPDGITVNCICPGSIRHRPGDDPDEPAPQIPIGRYGRPADVAELVAWLASDAARYLTGAVIVLDGGATAGRARASRKR